MSAKSVSWDLRPRVVKKKYHVNSLTALGKHEGHEFLNKIIGRNVPMPYIPGTPDQDPIIIAIDTEHFPVREDRQTEVGLAILDTKKIRGIQPGLHAENWISHIRARHLRVWETGTWITYAVDKFTGEKLWAGNKFAFGRSEWLTAPSIYRALHDEFLVHNPTSHALRRIVLVGHAWQNEEKFLATMFAEHANKKAFTFNSFGTVAAVLDIQTLLSVWGAARHHRISLNEGLRRGGYHNTIRHNAGNDAVYVLALLLRLAADTATPKPKHLLVPARHRSPQDILNRLSDLACAKYPAVQEDRCSACGRFGHSDLVCVWLRTCRQCGKNGFCVHRPRPEGWIAGERRGPRGHVGAVLQKVVSAPLGGLRADAPVFRPSRIAEAGIDRVVEAEEDDWGMEEDMGLPAVWGPMMNKVPEVVVGEEVVTASEKSDERAEKEELERKGGNVCLRCPEIDHQIAYCPQRMEFYGW